jgi:hypothetical protein
LRETEKWFRGGENCFVRAGVTKQLGGPHRSGMGQTVPNQGDKLLDMVILSG